MTKDVRRDPRFQVRESQLVAVSAIRTADESGSEISGAVLDLSRGGLRLRLEGHLPKGEEVRLTITTSQFDCQIQSTATVRWAEPDAGDKWIIGCDFKEKIPHESIQELATTGTLDRRNDARRPLSFTAEARTELGNSFQAVQVVDISAGGFSALGGELGAKSNDRLLLKVTTDSSEVSLIRARVAWVHDLEGGQSLGCVFLTKADHSQMHSIAIRGDDIDTETQPDDDQSQSSTKWAMVGATVFAIIVAQFFLFRT